MNYDYKNYVLKKKGRSNKDLDQIVKKFQDELGQIKLEDIKKRNAAPENYKPISEDPMKTLAKNDVEGLNERSKYNSELYKAYIEYYKGKCNQNLKLKNKFFRNFMAFLAWIIVIIPAFIIVIVVIKKELSNAEVICALSGSAATIVTSIIVIPKIIAKYLFSTKEDKIISELLKEIQTHDIETRKNTLIQDGSTE